MKNLFYLSTVFFLVLISLTNGIAQFNGSVIDALSSEALVGANITIDNAKGTTTDAKGKFSIEINNEQILEISYLGYESQVIDIKDIDLTSAVIFRLNPAMTLMQTTTVTASRYEKGLAESTVSLEVIKPDFIKSTNTNSIDDLLERVPGVQILDGSASIRGGSGFSFGAGSRVMVLVDDLPLLQGDSGTANWGDMPVENIDRIEVLKGAGSALYGSAAMNGVINIKTGRPTTTPKTKAFVSYTQFQDPQDIRKKWWTSKPNTLNVGAVHLRKIGNLDLSTSFNYLDNDDYNLDEYEKQWRLTTRLDYRLTDRLKLAIALNYNKRESANFFLWRDAGAGVYQPRDGTLSSGDRNRFNIDPSLVFYGDKGLTHKLLSRFYRVDNQNNLDQSNQSNSSYAEYQALKKWQDLDAVITAGAVYNRINSDSELFGDTSITYVNTAAYVQVEKKFYDRWSIAGGLRYERYDVDVPGFVLGEEIPEDSKSDDQLISRLGINYELAEASFLRASFGQSYRFPTIAERYIATELAVFSIFPNVDLEPETGFTTEIAMKQGFRWKGIDGYVDLAGFWQQYDNMLEFAFQQKDGVLGFQSQNVGNTQISGVELSLLAKTIIGKMPLRIYGGYTYLDPKYRDFETNEQLRSTLSTDENVLKYRTNHLLKIDVETNYKSFSLGFTAEKTSHMINIDESLESIALIGTYRKLNNEGYFFYNARIAYTLSNYKLSLHLNNINNTEYTRRPGYLEGPRNIALRFDVDI